MDGDQMADHDEAEVAQLRFVVLADVEGHEFCLSAGQAPAGKRASTVDKIGRLGTDTGWVSGW
jgi:hypothetical protein